jgi:hypothetical protein
MNTLFSRRRRLRVTILKARKAKHVPNGERLYEIGFQHYGGPATLEPGTVLEIVSTPKEK